jgi:hypothetical protein
VSSAPANLVYRTGPPRLRRAGAVGAWQSGPVSDDHLSGGRRTREVTRIGGTVRRTRGPEAHFVGQVLMFLEHRGYQHAPRHLGVDELGRDVLTYIPGGTTDHPSQRDAGAYGVGGQMLRELHDLTTGSVLAAGHECVIHGDPGPFNTIFQRGRPVAFIDWDSCRPGRRLEDLAYMGWTWCVQSVGNVPIDQQAIHLRRLRDGYGPVEAAPLLDMMLARQTQIADSETLIANDRSLSPARRLLAEEAVAWATGDRDLLHRNRTRFLQALQRSTAESRRETPDW